MSRRWSSLAVLGPSKVAGIILRAGEHPKGGYRCAWCSEPVHFASESDNPNTPPAFGAWSIDHVIPRHAGGDNESDNLVLAHLWCNIHRLTTLQTTSAECERQLAASLPPVEERRRLAHLLFPAAMRRLARNRERYREKCRRAEAERRRKYVARLKANPGTAAKLLMNSAGGVLYGRESAL